jgi:hypothetical protein
MTTEDFHQFSVKTTELCALQIIKKDKPEVSAEVTVSCAGNDSHYSVTYHVSVEFVVPNK